MSDLVVVVHDGVFHADEVLAVGILELWARMRAGRTLSVIRTRDPERIAQADYAVDVGGRFEPDLGYFDHHQVVGVGVRGNGIPYAAAGLVWDRFGAELVVAMEPALAVAQAERVWAMVDKDLVQPVDAVDNGIAPGGQSSFTLSAMVTGFNPDWRSRADANIRFGAAVAVMRDVLSNAVAGAASRVLSEGRVRAALAEEAAGIVVLKQALPWKEIVCRESESALFVVYPGSHQDWRCQAVPDAPTGFGMRRPLPKAWAGLEGSDLASVTGVADARFCHRGRFICGARTEASAIRLAKLAITGAWQR